MKVTFVRGREEEGFTLKFIKFLVEGGGLRDQKGPERYGAYLAAGTCHGLITSYRLRNLRSLC